MEIFFFYTICIEPLEITTTGFLKNILAVDHDLMLIRIICSYA